MSITYIPVTCTRLLRFATPFKIRAIVFVPYIDLPLRDILNYFPLAYYLDVSTSNTF